MSISKQRSFVYWPNFQWRFWFNNTNLRADIEVTKTHLFNLISYLSIEFSEAEPSLPPKEYKKLSISTTSWVDLKKNKKYNFIRKFHGRKKIENKMNLIGIAPTWTNARKYYTYFVVFIIHFHLFYPRYFNLSPCEIFR